MKRVPSQYRSSNTIQIETNAENLPVMRKSQIHRHIIIHIYFIEEPSAPYDNKQPIFAYTTVPSAIQPN